MKTICYTLFFSLLLAVAPVKAQDLLNADFEQLNDTLPANWTVSDFGAGLNDNYMQSGQYSMAVWNWYYYGKGTAVNGQEMASIWSDRVGCGTPATEKAAYLNGYYLYDTTGTDSNNDTALITVTFRKKNGPGYDTVAYGISHLLPTPAGALYMVPFSVRIDDLRPGTDPDTMLVFLQSSLNGFCDASGGGNCLYLYVDKLSFSDTAQTTGITDMPQLSLNLFPNPAENTVTVAVPVENGQLNLLDISGRLLQSITVARGNNTIDISAQAKGLYLVELVENGKVLSRQKLIKY